jgi:hypothetical protein
LKDSRHGRRVELDVSPERWTVRFSEVSAKIDVFDDHGPSRPDMAAHGFDQRGGFGEVCEHEAAVDDIEQLARLPGADVASFERDVRKPHLWRLSVRDIELGLIAIDSKHPTRGSYRASELERHITAPASNVEASRPGRDADLCEERTRGRAHDFGKEAQSFPTFDSPSDHIPRAVHRRNSAVWFACEVAAAYRFV